MLGVGIIGYHFMKMWLGKENDMKTQDLVAIMTANLLSGDRFQQKLVECKTPEETAKVVDEATAITQAVVLAAGSAEIKALDKQKRELEQKVEETKTRLEEISRGLDEAIKGQQSSVAQALQRAISAAAQV